MVFIEEFTPEQIRKLFKPKHYECIPLEYINYVRVTYKNGRQRVFKRDHIAKAIKDVSKSHKDYARVFNLYNNDNVEEIDIDINFELLASQMNDTIKDLFGIQ